MVTLSLPDKTRYTLSLSASSVHCTKTKIDMTAQNSVGPDPAKNTLHCDSSSDNKCASSAEQLDAEHNVQSDSPIQGQRLIDQWLNQYAFYHRNSLNKKIHFICVPLIMFSILGLLWSIPMPKQVSTWGTWINAATLITILTSIYYTRLSPCLAIGMVVTALASLVILEHTEQWLGISVWQFSILLFLIAWIGQFLGHHIEGKRPAFANDLQFLLIGPLWILAALYRRLGILY